jgi:hypothetical protein
VVDMNVFLSESFVRESMKPSCRDLLTAAFADRAIFCS